MTRLWPFIGIALAVSLGVALAPYFWWVVALAAIAGAVTLALGVGWIAWQYVVMWWSRLWGRFLALGVDPD